MTAYVLHPITPIPELVRCMLLDRQSAEAAELFGVLMRYTNKRVFRTCMKCGTVLNPCDREEIVADVLLSLMEGSLARFQGQTLAQLLAFVRTVADRTTWRAIRRKETERDALRSVDADMVRDWISVPSSPDSTELRVSSPLTASDQKYLRELMIAGGKANLSRRLNVSRAAVSQRVARIRQRIASLSATDSVTHGVWMKQAASEALLLCA